MKEIKIDKLIRKTFNSDQELKPSVDFTAHVMEKMGVKTTLKIVKEKPIKSKWGLFLTIFFYVLLAASFFFFPQTGESSVNILNYFSLPSIGEYLNLSESFSKMILILIVGGWILILSDKYFKKLFMR